MIKVDDLIGPELDGHVARAHNKDGYIINEGSPAWPTRYFVTLPGEVRYSPSTSWALGGPIIQAERITVAAIGRTQKTWFAELDGAELDNGVEVGYGKYSAEGPTALVAAMRAFVRSRFGDEVPGTAK